MTSAPRQQVIDALAGLTPDDFRVLPHERGIDRPEHITVLIELRRVTPTPERIPGVRQYTFDIALVVPQRDLDAASTALDDALHLLLGAIDDAPMLLWTEAQRGQHRETELPAFVVTAVATDQ